MSRAPPYHSDPLAPRVGSSSGPGNRPGVNTRSSTGRATGTSVKTGIQQFEQGSSPSIGAARNPESSNRSQKGYIYMYIWRCW